MMPSSSENSSQESRLILILLLIQISHVLDFVMMMPMGPQLIRDLGLSGEEFGMILSSYAFIAAGLGLVSSMYMDRFDRKKILLICYGGFAVATILCGVSSTYFQLLAARSLAGGSGGLISGIVLAIIADQVPAHRRGAAFGKMMTAFPICSVLGIPVALYVSERLSWHTPFLMLGAASAVLFFFIPKVIPPVERQSAIEVLDLESLPIRHLALGLSATLFMTMASFMIVPFVSIAFVSMGGVAEKDLYIVFAVAGVFTLFTSKFFGKLTDRYEKFYMYLIMSSISIVGALLVTQLPSRGLLVVVPVTVLFMVFNSGRAVALTSFLYSRIPVAIRGQFSTLNSSMQSMAAGLGSIIASKIVIIGPNQEMSRYDWNGFASVGFLFLTVVFLVMFRRKTQDQVLLVKGE